MNKMKMKLRKQFHLTMASARIKILRNKFNKGSSNLFKGRPPKTQNDLLEDWALLVQVSPTRWML